ncbi:unnamed protein product [Absidia cylindrospora]
MLHGRSCCVISWFAGIVALAAAAAVVVGVVAAVAFVVAAAVAGAAGAVVIFFVAAATCCCCYLPIFLRISSSYRGSHSHPSLTTSLQRNIRIKIMSNNIIMT